MVFSGRFLEASVHSLVFIRYSGRDYEMRGHLFDCNGQGEYGWRRKNVPQKYTQQGPLACPYVP